MAKHARLGCSNPRWSACPGSVAAEERYPNISGEAAIDGTGSHLLLELCLDSEEDAAYYLDTLIGVNSEDKPEGWMVNQDRVDRVQMCLDYVARRKRELAEEFPDAQITIEAESHADPGGYFGRTDWWGTCDITITVVCDGVLLFCEVADYKDGRQFVKADGNTQLYSYLGGKIRPWIGSGPLLVRPFNTHLIGPCRVTIVQPKTNPVVRSEDVSAETVMGLLTSMANAARKTDEPDAELVAGDHCSWCRANPKRGGHCNKAVSNSLAKVESMSTELIVKDGQSLFEYVGNMVADPTTLTEVQLADLADARDGLVAAFDRVMDEIQKRIDAGQDVPGYAMRPGNAKRVWAKDEAEIEKALKGRRLRKDQIYPPKLISVAQALKHPDLTDAQKAKIEEDLVTTMAGKLTLKKVARQEKPAPAEMFADVIEPETPTISFF